MNFRLDTRPAAALAPVVSAQGQYRPVSFWQESIPIAPGAPLAQDLTCDVAVVGGGFSGVSTAYELKRTAPELEVVLIESGVIGHGASGRNGGFAMPLVGWDLSHTVGQLGRDEGRRAYELMYRAVDHVKRTVAEHGLACDLEATGYLLLATCAARKRHLRHEAELGHAFGFGYEYLEGDALRAHIASEAFLAGVYDPRPAVLNPAKLARGLKTLAESAGVRIFEQTPLIELREGAPLTLVTPQGRIAAKRVVMAVNGYGGALGFMAAQVLPVHTYIVLTEPLSPAQLGAIGWGAKRTSLETARNFIHYFRLTADNRILFGGEDVELLYGGRYRDAQPDIFRALEERFRAYFPALREVRFTHQWGGVLGVTLDMFPSLGRCGEHGTIFYATGYSGHGVALSNYAGRLLAPAILASLGGQADARELEEAFFFNRRPMRLPPDPLRYAGLQAYRYALHGLDRIQRA